MSKDKKTLLLFVTLFLVAYFAPLSSGLLKTAMYEGAALVQWYARNHTLACVLPALFIAGAITTFLSKEAVLRHLGPKANKVEAYCVASVSGTILAVCSCSVLPMFAGIYRVGAGLGPASAFLYAGPAINVMALFLTARVLGIQIGIARAVGAVVFGLLIGLIMAVVFRKDEKAREAAAMHMPDAPAAKRTRLQTGLFFVAMVMFLVFSDWFNPGNVVVTLNDEGTFEAVVRQETRDGYVFQLSEATLGHERGTTLEMAKQKIASVVDVDNWVVRIHHIRWYLALLMGVAVLAMTWRWFDRDEVTQWMGATWGFAKLLLPLLFGGVFAVGFLGAMIPEEEVANWVGDNSIKSNLIASVVGCLFYFATLTEVPILETLMSHGMAEGPALALLLAGPALSIPSILVIRSVIGNRKTIVFTALVIVMATIVGTGYGYFFGESDGSAETQAAVVAAEDGSASVDH